MIKSWWCLILSFFWQRVNILVRSGTWLCSGLKWTWVLVLGEARWPDIHCTMISISFIKFCPTLCPPWVIETICQYISWPFNGDFASVVSSNKVLRVGFLFIDHRGPSPPIYVIGICCLFFFMNPSFNYLSYDMTGANYQE